MPQEQLLLPKTLFVLHLTFTMFLQPDRPHARFEGHLEKRQASPLSSTKVVFKALSRMPQGAKPTVPSSLGVLSMPQSQNGLPLWLSW